MTPILLCKEYSYWVQGLGVVGNLCDQTGYLEALHSDVIIDIKDVY